MNILLSHPDTKLRDHLEGVLLNSVRMYEEMNITSSYGDDYLKVVKLIALFHDFGKCTSYFQNYIRGNKSGSPILRQHSILGAIVVSNLIISVVESKYAEELSLYAFISVLYHHANLNNLYNKLCGISSKKTIELLRNQIDEISFDLVNETFNPLLKKHLSIEIIFTAEVLTKYVDTLKSSIRKLNRTLRELKDSNSFESYLHLMTFWSLLVDADKKHANFKEVLQKNTSKIDTDAAKKYIMKFPKDDSTMSKLRTEAFETVEQNILTSSNQAGIFSVELPTGAGKTLTVLNAALLLRNKRYDETGKYKKIINGLPFLSIIDQTAKVYRNVFDLENSNSDVMTVQHSLADYSLFKQREIEYKDDSRAEMLIETWESEIIVTTFVQIFHTLFTNKNGNARKFHTLSNSILMLDEVQAIPSKYHKLVNEMFQSLVTVYNTDIITMTATTIYEFDNSKSLCDATFYNGLDRIVLKYFDEVLTIEEFFKKLDLKVDKSYMFVMNTIKSAKILHQLLSDSLQEEVAFLSTEIIPFQRLGIISDIKNKKYRLLVTTQLIEAGVDITFDVVYRDMTRMDSIMQTAGRCNRHYSDKQGEVNVIKLKDKKKEYAEYIYDSMDLFQTSETLKTYVDKQNNIRESSFYNLIKDFSTKLHTKTTDSNAYIEAVNQLRFVNSQEDEYNIATFKLIDDSDYEKIDVFIEYNQEAVDIWQKYLQIKKIENRFDRKLQFKLIKNIFQKYVISVSKQRYCANSNADGLYYIPQGQLEFSYGKVGFLGFGLEANNII